MRTEEVIGICRGVVETETDKLFNAIKLLPTKDDLTSLVDAVEQRLLAKIQSQDDKISTLQSQVKILEDKHSTDIKKINELTDKIEILNTRLDTIEVKAIESDAIIDEKVENLNQQFESSQNFRSGNDKEELDLIILGDSIVKRIDANAVLTSPTTRINSPEAKVRVESISGAGIQEIYERAQDLSEQYRTKKIILHVGANHIPKISPRSLSFSIIRLIEGIQALFPPTDIFYSAILPKKICQLKYRNKSSE